MSMSANNEYRIPETVDDSADGSRHNASPVLLVLLGLAIAAAALVWWSQSQRTRDLPVATAPLSVPAAQDEANRTVPATERGNTAARERAPRAVATRPAVSRDARPLASNAEPRYPAAMLRAGVGGSVVVLAEVDAQGHPVNVRLVERSGERELDRAALSAVRQWRFEPAMRNGKPVAAQVRVPVDFKPI